LSESSHITIGKIAAPHGTRGLVKFFPFCSGESSIGTLKKIYLKKKGSHFEQFELISVKKHKRFYLLNLKGMETRENALRIVNSNVYALREDLPRMKEGEFYYCDLIGCRVKDESGKNLGVVKKVFPTGANEVMVCRSDDEEVLIPVVEGIIKKMDLANEEVIVSLPEEID
jgi:16S rRNA processing protein RimM